MGFLVARGLLQPRGANNASLTSVPIPGSLNIFIRSNGARWRCVWRRASCWSFRHFFCLCFLRLKAEELTLLSARLGPHVSLPFPNGRDDNSRVQGRENCLFSYLPPSRCPAILRKVLFYFKPMQSVPGRQKKLHRGARESLVGLPALSVGHWLVL